MFLFNLLRKFFGWADEAPRKRRAVSFSLEKEFVTPKKHKCNYNIDNVEDDPIEIDEDSDSDVEIFPQSKYFPTSSTPRLNGTGDSRGSKNKSYRYCTTRKYSTPTKTVPPCCKKSSMGYFQSNSKKIQNIGSDHRCPTLSKTHRLKEKNQYEELLQNFLPRRIHIIRDKPADHQPEVVEIIDLDKSTSPTTSSKPQKTSKVQNVSQSQWSAPNKSKPEKETITIIDNDKMDSGKKDNTPHSSAGKNEVQIVAPSPKKATVSKHIECVAINSLRDQFAAKAVMREDFIPQIVKRYDERIEQCSKEAEELKKMTCLLSKRNRLTRVAALEEQLARSMRLQEAVLDEREEPEEPALPTLTDEMLQEVKSALIPRPPHEVLVEGFGLRITRKDIHTLASLNWLNDEVINFYMNLLIARGGKDNYPKVQAMNTFFYPKLVSGGHASLKRWTRKVDIFAQDLIVVPVHLGIHWCMSIIDFRDKSIRYYDSMGSSNPKCLSALREYLEYESLDKKKQAYDTSDWKLECAKDIPQQMNGSDCGVFSCIFAEYICANRKITFTQQDMPYFRNKMVYEILKSKLL